MWPAVEQLGDEGVRRSFGWMLAVSPVLDHDAHLKAFAKRATLLRRWQLFLERYPLMLCPVSGEPPFACGLDVESEATMKRLILAGALPMGVQLIGPRFREDLLLDAAEVIEACCPPLTPIDPRGA